MACKDKNKFVTSEAASKAALRTQGIIDEFLNIKQLQKFREKVTLWTNDAKERFGVTERLFTEDGLKAVPNKKAFKQIDNAKGIFYQLDNNVNFSLKSFDILSSERANQIFYKGNKNNWSIEKILSELGVPKDQVNILKSFNTRNREELLTSLLANYSYTIEVNTATGEKINDRFTPQEVFFYNGDRYEYEPENDVTGELRKEQWLKNEQSTTKNEYENALKKYQETNNKPTSYYSNLTVPGGTNYTENEISTPLITPSIKGHAQFSTDNGIGWFRSDESIDEKATNPYGNMPKEMAEVLGYSVKGVATKTRRILEVQSDLFQKGRDKDILISPTRDTNTIERLQSSENQFLQLLNKDNNWVRFFVKSIIQDSAKKGYEKVLFPSGATITKIENFDKVQEKIDEFNSEIKTIENGIKNKPEYIGIEHGREDSRETKIKEIKKDLQHYLDAQKDTLSTINFYENTVKNILKKNYSINEITDEYGNTWNEITIDQEREQQNILLQNKELPSSEASKETLDKVKEAANKMGIDIQSLTEYAKNTGLDTKSINGVADLVKGVIAIAHGMESVTLTEEFVHIATAILEQTNPKLVTELISKIDRFKIYKQTLESYKNNKNYQLSNGKPDIRKIKKEAVDKLITEVIINNSENTTQFPELLQETNKNLVQQWWNTIKDFIRGVYRKTNINIFEEAAKTIIGDERSSAQYNNILPTAALKTFNFGSKEGSPQNIQTNKVIHNNIINHPDKSMFDEGESFDEAFKRTIPTVQRIIDNAPTNAVIVTHNSVFGLINLWNQQGRPITFNKEQRELYTKQDNTFPTGASFEIDSPNGPLTVVRHGETSDNLRKVFRTSNTTLTDEGIKEATEKGKELSNKNISEIYTSSLPRAIHTSNLLMNEQTDKQSKFGTVADIKSGGQFYQLQNDDVDKFVSTIIDRDNRMILNPETPTDKRHYTLDGEKIAMSVTEKIKKGIKMATRTPEQQEVDNQKKMWGTDGHEFIYNHIINNLIDKNGYKRTTPLEVSISTPLNEDVQRHLSSFAKELINSYPEGTRFLVERKVVNEKVKGKLASTIDFMAVIPDAKTKIKVDVLDWKFFSINKNNNDDIQWYKQEEWKKQMGEYSKILYNYGLKPDQLRKARMIPFVANYSYKIAGDSKSGLNLSSLEIGNLDTIKETNLYLLPIPINSESTGNKEIDTLVASLRSQYEKLYKKIVSPDKRDSKNLQLNELNKAIRVLQLKLDFAPLDLVGRNFLKNTNEVFKSFEGLNYDKLTKEEIDDKLTSLLEIRKSAEKYADLDETFLSLYPKEDLEGEQLKLFQSLERLSLSTGRMLKKVTELERAYAVQLSLKEKITTESTKDSILNAEREIVGLNGKFNEPSRLPSKIINLDAKITDIARSQQNISIGELIDKFEPIVIASEKEAKAQGKTAFDMIGIKGDKNLSLIQKIDRQLYKSADEASSAKDKRFFIENMDMDKYNTLVKDIIDKQSEDIDETIYSSDDETNYNEREFRKIKLNDNLDINRKTFNGFDTFGFRDLFIKSLNEEDNLSNEYKQMSKYPAALALWNFMMELNKRGRDNGYLSHKGTSFFPLMEATSLQRLSNASNRLSEVKDLVKDSYSVRAEEEYEYSKLDPETNQIRREIPKLFTYTDRAIHQLSTDMTRVGSLWIKALLQYETSKSLESTRLILLNVERNKGHIVVDGDKIVLEAGTQKIDLNSNKNADLLQVIIDDDLYELKENLNSIGNISIKGITNSISKSEGESDARSLSGRKILNNGNKWVQVLGVGLKSLVSIPHYINTNFQQYINAGSFYRGNEFEKNQAKILIPGGLSMIEKLILNKIVPLTDDLAKEKIRHIASKQGIFKWLSEWTLNDVAMHSNSFTVKKIQLANAKSFMDNSIVRNGQIVGIRQYLKAQDEVRYKTMPYEQRRALEKSFNTRVEALKSENLAKISSIIDNDVVIPGIDTDALARYRVTVVAYARQIADLLSETDKADYRRDAVLRSFMMFRNWIPKGVILRAGDITHNAKLDEWQYGRVRLFVKTWKELGLWHIAKMRDIISGTDKGIAIMNQMLQDKRDSYKRKTGQDLEITDEQFYDMVRKELVSEVKELGIYISLMAMLLAMKAVAPGAGDGDRNKYNYWSKALNKLSERLSFYYNPISFDNVTRGSVLPIAGLLTMTGRAFKHIGDLTYYEITGNDKMIKQTHVAKYIIDPIPGVSSFNAEFLPYFFPDLAKEMGERINPTAEKR